jgi:ectoine hydroxylase-related dioxygenase (phytanoyl-CoA dioxygenase family)
LLTKNQIIEYQENGFVVPDFKMSEKDLLDIEVKHNQLIKNFPEFKNYCPALLLKDESFLQYCLNEKILDFVKQLIGKKIALWNSSFFAKPAYNGLETPWHQDGQYWPIDPLATCTVWLAIDSATEENGCLRFIKGSHKNQKLKKHYRNDKDNLTLQQELNKSEYDINKSVSLILKRGQISLHDVYLVHGSKENKSPNQRRAMTMRYMPLTSKFDHSFFFDSNPPFKIDKVFKSI